MESIRIPPELKTIETWTFYGCTNLKRTVFPEGLEKIDIAAFSESGIECVDLPSSVRGIDAEAFAKCANLRSARLNEGLEVLGTYELTPDDKQC